MVLNVGTFWRKKQRKSPSFMRNWDFFGARYRTRTCDPMHVKHVLYQLS